MDRNIILLIYFDIDYLKFYLFRKSNLQFSLLDYIYSNLKRFQKKSHHSNIRLFNHFKFS